MGIVASPPPPMAPFPYSPAGALAVVTEGYVVGHLPDLSAARVHARGAPGASGPGGPGGPGGASGAAFAAPSEARLVARWVVLAPAGGVAIATAATPGRRAAVEIPPSARGGGQGAVFAVADPEHGELGLLNTDRPGEVLVLRATGLSSGYMRRGAQVETLVRGALVGRRAWVEQLARARDPESREWAAEMRGGAKGVFDVALC